MAWTTPKTWTVNEVVTAANMNTHVRDNVAFLGGVPTCSVSNSANQNIATGTLTVLTANTEPRDTDTMHSTVSNTSRITANTAGAYIFCATVAFVPNATGYRQGIFRKNGTTDVLGGCILPTVGVAADTVISWSQLIDLAATDYIEVRASQTSGGNLDARLHDFSAIWQTF